LDKAALVGISRLLESYNHWQEQRQVENYHALEDSLFRMRDELDILRQRAEKDEYQHASRFNIFSLLGVQNNEVNTHSRLLGELLLPSGTHAQGVLFLEKFLEMVAEEDEEFQLPELPLDGEQWQVIPEQHTVFGYIDLVISSREGGCLVVIENKIWASEQESQLERYSTWMKTMKAGHPAQALIYLTPDGRDSQTANQARYKPLAYRPNIVNWLEECLPKIQAPRVAETIRQYLDVIRSF
jgi:hypothetical protein